jgi:Zn-dependent M28 family amino/carboxypeptidase
VHNGADDNASGVSAMLEIAPKNGIESMKIKVALFLLPSEPRKWGFWISKFVESESSGDNIKAMINLDMVGRLTKEIEISGNKNFNAIRGYPQESKCDSNLP